MSALSETLQAAMKAKEWSVRDLTEHTPLREDYIINWINDCAQPGLAGVHHLCTALGISADHLLGVPEPTPTRAELKAAIRRLIWAKEAPSTQDVDTDTIDGIVEDARALLGE